MNNINDKVRALFKIGTPLCGLTFAVIGALLTALAIGIGIPKTLLIMVIALAAAFVGGVKNKLTWLRDLINRLFPPRTEDLGKPEDWQSKRIHRQPQGGEQKPQTPGEEKKV